MGGGWRSLAGAAVVFAAWQLTGLVGAGAADALAPLLRLQPAYDVMLRLAGAFTASLGLVGALWAVQHALHRRTLRSLVTAGRGISWRRVATGAGTWAVLLLITEALGAFADPGAYTWTIRPVPLIASLLTVVPLLALESVGEELYFRGYLMQAVSRWTRRPWLLVVASAVLFTLPHVANPEVTSGGWSAAVAYALAGAFLAAISLRDGRLELAIGIHVANNLVAAVVVGASGSVLAGTAPLATTTASSPLVTLAVLAAQGAAFWVLVFRGPPRRDGAGADPAADRPAT